MEWSFISDTNGTDEDNQMPVTETPNSVAKLGNLLLKRESLHCPEGK